MLTPSLPLCVSLLLLLCFILWDVDTDGKLCRLSAILVLHQQGVFARVDGCNSSDGDAGKLAVLKLQRVVIVRQQRFIILHPADLGNWITPDVASEVERLKWMKRDKMSDHIINILFTKYEAHIRSIVLPCPPEW